MSQPSVHTLRFVEANRGTQLMLLIPIGICGLGLCLDEGLGHRAFDAVLFFGGIGFQVYLQRLNRRLLASAD